MGFIGAWSVAVNLGFTEFGSAAFRWFSGVQHPDIKSVFETCAVLNGRFDLFESIVPEKRYLGKRLIIVANGRAVAEPLFSSGSLRCRVGFVPEPFHKLIYAQDEAGSLGALCLLQNPYGIDWCAQSEPKDPHSNSSDFDIILEPDYVSSDTIWSKNDSFARQLQAKDKVSLHTFYNRLLWRSEYESVLLTLLREIVLDSDSYKNFTLSESYGIWPWRHHIPACRLAGESPIIQTQQTPVQKEFEHVSNARMDLGFEALSEICEEFFHTFPIAENLKPFCRPVATDVLLINCEVRASKLIKILQSLYSEIIFLTSRHVNNTFAFPQRVSFSPFSKHYALHRFNRTNLPGEHRTIKEQGLSEIYKWWSELFKQIQVNPIMHAKIHTLNQKLGCQIFQGVKNIVKGYEKILLALAENKKWHLEQSQKTSQHVAQIEKKILIPMSQFKEAVNYLNQIASQKTRSTLRLQWHDCFWMDRRLYAIVDYADPNVMVWFQNYIKTFAESIGQSIPDVVIANDAYSANIFITKANQPVTLSDIKYAENITKILMNDT